MKKIFNLADTRMGWSLMAGSAFAIFLAALFFQHVMGMNPCVMCIEERMLVLAIGLVALIPIISPKNMLLRAIGYLSIVGVAIVGFNVVTEHLIIQSGESLFAICSIYPRLPTWLPLHEWLPSLFMPNGDCGDIDWVFLSLTMVEWVKVVFSIYIAIPILMIIGRKGL